MSAKKRAGVFLLVFFLLVIPLTVWSVKNLNFETRKKAEEPTLPVKVISASSFSQYQKPIILLDLLIDRPNKSIEIVSIKKGTGIVPDYRNPTALDYLKANFNNKDGSKKSFLIPLPARESIDQVAQDGKLSGYEKSLDKFHFSVTLPHEEESDVSIEKRFTSVTTAIAASASTRLILPKFDQTKARVINKGVAQELPLEELSSNGILHSQSGDFQIEEIYNGDPSLTDPEKTVDILFISSGFSGPQSELYRNFTADASDSLIGFSSHPGKFPFPEHKNITKVRRVVSPATYNYECIPYSMPQIDWQKIDEDVARLGIPVDQLSVVVNCAGRSYATLGGGWSVLSFSEYQSPLVFAHEIAHSFGGVLDEYVSYEGSGDLWDYGRNCKEDPSEPWLENLPGGAYFGCDYYRNIYRPEKESLMNSIGESYSFNAPSKHLLEEAFAAYTQGGISVMAASGRIRIWRRLTDPPGPQDNGFSVFNLGRSQLSFRGHFEPQVEWATGKVLEGIIGSTPSDYVADIIITLNYAKLTTKGKYETSLVLEFADNFSHTKIERIPLIILVGDETSMPVLSITSPRDGDTFTLGDIIPISISQQIEPPGWKRMEYLYSVVYDGSADYFIPISVRTIWPHTVSWDTAGSPEYPIQPGNYHLLANGYPYLAPSPEVKSNTVNIELLAPTGLNCYFQWNCTDKKYSESCFRFAEDCRNKGLTYCCPPTVTPSPFPTSIPCPNRFLGNLDCDQQALINENDLSVLLVGWGSAETDLSGDNTTGATDSSILLSNWRTQ